MPSPDLENDLAAAYSAGHDPADDDGEPGVPRLRAYTVLCSTPGMLRTACVVAHGPHAALSRAILALPGEVVRLDRLDVDPVLLPDPPAPSLPARVLVLHDYSGEVLGVAETREALAVLVHADDRGPFVSSASPGPWRPASSSRPGHLSSMRVVEVGTFQEPRAAAPRVVPPGAAVVDAPTVEASAAPASSPSPRSRHHEELDDLSKLEGTVRYVRMKTPGDVRFLPFGAFASHAGLVGAEERGQVLSAGRVFVDRDRRTVSMDQRDSHSLCVDSAPGDEDARAIAALLFPVEATSA